MQAKLNHMIYNLVEVLLKHNTVPALRKISWRPGWFSDEGSEIQVVLSEVGMGKVKVGR